MVNSDVVYKRILIEPMSKEEDQARCLLAEAEKLEDQSNHEESAKCYRKAFKMWPALEKEFGK
jgi:tetratricopeptide (TPR) repeat protein